MEPQWRAVLGPFKKPTAAAKKSTREVDNIIEKWKTNDRVDEDELELSELLEAYDREGEDFEANRDNFSASADFYHAPSRDARESPATFDVDEIGTHLGKIIHGQGFREIKGTKPIQISEGLSIGGGRVAGGGVPVREKLGILKPTGINIETLTDTEVRDFSAEHFHPSKRDIYDLEEVKNLEQYLNKYNLSRSGGGEGSTTGPILLTYKALTDWHDQMQRYTNCVFDQKHMEDRVVFVYLVTRPTFVHCIFKVVRRKTTVEKKKKKKKSSTAKDCLYVWKGHFYSLGRGT